MKLLYKLMLVLASMFYLTATNAQVDTSTTEKLIDYILQSVDKSQVPTGFLAETGAHILPMQTFNGTLSDSNSIDINLWRTMYLQLQTSYVGGGSNPLPDIVTVNSTIKSNSTASLPTPIPLLMGTYNTVAANAFSNNLLSYNSSQKRVYDVAGRSQSPYASNMLFAACATDYISKTGADNFIIPSSLVYNTTGKAISQVSINFANGQGFTNVSIGTTFTATYTDTGYKRWTIKVTFTDNTTLQCYQDYYVTAITSSGSTTTFSYPGSYTTSRTFQRTFAATTTDSGAVVTIAYTAKNATNTLRKPLIVVEGYDVHTIAPGTQNYNYDYILFVNSIKNEPVGFNFNSYLDDTAGYDIVFIDFTSGTDSIQRNARLVQRVILWVDSLKAVNGSTQQNVVMGLSMGGLVARYALADMTKRNIPTQTRLLITHDSPHRGANIPLGFQYFIKMLGNVNFMGRSARQTYPQYDEFNILLEAPASKQMLLYRATSTNTYEANTFLDGEYRSMVTFAPTDPQPSYRFIATSLGSEVQSLYTTRTKHL